MKKRLSYLDALKGIGMFGIVSQHVVTGLDDPFNLWLATIKIVCFFIVSGMLMSMSDKEISFKEFAIKKFKAIMLPYFAFSFLIIISDFFISGFSVNVLAVDVINTIILRGAGAIWFLPVFYFGNLLFLLIKNKNIPALVILIVLLSVSAFGLGIVSSKFDEMGAIFKLISRVILVIGKSFMATSFFAIGYLSNKTLAKSNPNVLLGVLMLSLSVFAAQFVNGLDLNFLKFSSNPIAFYIAAITGTLGLSIILKQLELKFKLEYKILAYLSVNSLLIMGTHYYYNIIPFARSLANNFNGLLYYVVAVSVVSLIEVIVVEVVNRTKIKKLLFI